jgi:hypothetical protein
LTTKEVIVKILGNNWLDDTFVACNVVKKPMNMTYFLTLKSTIIEEEKIFIEEQGLLKRTLT